MLIIGESVKVTRKLTVLVLQAGLISAGNLKEIGMNIEE